MRKIIAILCSLFILANSLAAQRRKPQFQTRLVVLLVFDQFRSDYLTRFKPYFLPSVLPDHRVGGFSYLMEHGGYFADAEFDHYPLVTGPGHAVISTGGEPYETHIIGDTWYDAEKRKETYCVEDPQFGVSPQNLASTTIGDELKLATGGKSKVVALSFKDRAAVLLGGFTADDVLWLDSKKGEWVTSAFYASKVPDWVAQVNAQKWMDKEFGVRWSKLLPEKDYLVSRKEGFSYVSSGKGLGKNFPHVLDGGLKNPGPAFYEALEISPYGIRLTFQMAEEAVKSEKLGKGEKPDLLAVNFATTDYVGHAFGPYSPEVEDTAVRADRELSRFLNFLDRSVPGGLKSTLIVITADHGAAEVPEYLQSLRIPAYRASQEETKRIVEEDLVRRFGEGPWVLNVTPPYLYLDSQRFTSRKPDPTEEEVENEAASILLKQPWIEAAFTRTQILQGKLPENEIGKAIAKSFVPRLSGSVVMIPRINAAWHYADSKSGATHQTPYAYDRHVPLLLSGPGIRPGTYTKRVGPKDIAPTLAYLLGTQFSAANEGRILTEALR